jgi:putative membrane protein
VLTLVCLYVNVNVNEFRRAPGPSSGGNATAVVRFILHALVAALGFWIASKVVPGVRVGGPGSLIAAGVILGIVNALVRPILILLTLPLTLITLGLFLFVVNGLTVWLVSAFLHGIHIGGLWPAILTALIISLTSWVAGVVIGRRGALGR